MNSYENIKKYFAEKAQDITHEHNKEYKYVFSKDNNDNHIIELVDSGTDKLVLKAKYSIMGSYNLYNSVWYWGYNLSFVNHAAAEGSKKLLKVADDIKKNYKKYKGIEADELHYLSSNPNFYCSLENLPKVIELGLFAMKGQWFVEIKYTANDDVVHGKPDSKKDPIKKIEYYCINEVLQKG